MFFFVKEKKPQNLKQKINQTGSLRDVIVPPPLVSATGCNIYNICCNFTIKSQEKSFRGEILACDPFRILRSF